MGMGCCVLVYITCSTEYEGAALGRPHWLLSSLGRARMNVALVSTVMSRYIAQIFPV